MIDEQYVRDSLRRRSEAISAVPAHPAHAIRKARRKLVGTTVVSLVLIAALATGTAAGLGSLGPPPLPAEVPTPTATTSPSVRDIDETTPEGDDEGVEKTATQPDRPPLEVLPPPSVGPSAPWAGTLLVSVSLEDRNGSVENRLTGLDLNVYADGRIVWRGSCDGAYGCNAVSGAPLSTSGPNTGWYELRVTPAAAEQIRSTIASIDLLDRGFHSESNGTRLADWLDIGVRVEDRFATSSVSYQILNVDPATDREVRSLSEAQGILTNLDGWLPASSWVERTARPFIPARYCLWFYPGPPDRSDLPAPADELAVRKFTAVSVDEARAVAEGLRAAGVRRATSGRGTSSGVGYRLTIPGADRTTLVFLEPLLPEQVDCG